MNLFYLVLLGHTISIESDKVLLGQIQLFEIILFVPTKSAQLKTSKKKLISIF